MISAEQWVSVRSRAEARAKKKFPNQPERARRMTDSECAQYSGPYQLEPLTFWQHIKQFLQFESYSEYE